MRPSSAIADLLLRGPGPARSRRLEYSRAHPTKPCPNDPPGPPCGRCRYLRRDRSERPRTVAFEGDASRRRGAAGRPRDRWMPARRRRPGRPPWSTRSSALVLAGVAGAMLGVTISAPGPLLPGSVPPGPPGQGRRADRRRRLHDGRTRPVEARSKSRLALAINRTAEAMADTHDRATVDRLTNVFNRQALLLRAVQRGRAGVTVRPPAVRRVRRHRPFQAGQRQLRARKR